MNENKIKAVIFDCDGVLFNTIKANETYYNKVLSLMGKPLLTEEQLKNVHMLSVDGSLKYLFGEDEFEKACECKKNINYLDLLPLLFEEPHLKEVLENLKKRFVLGIATNRTNTMDILLENHDLERFFETVVTAGDVPNPKPAPDQLHLIMENLNLKNDELIFIGDSTTDENAALAANVSFVAYKFEDARNVKYKINDLRDLINILS